MRDEGVLDAMPTRKRIDLDRVMAALDIRCPKCACTITPDRIRRLDFEQIECPECGEKFAPTAKQ